jgi:nitrite reductase (NADH) small subunit/3-phenylpropionate/trans-cinnamate dioxygenase ferredoxin subunit
VADFQTVAKVGAIADGGSATFVVDETMVAVFRIGPSYYAMSDCCPHMGASLAAGHVEGDTVTCPWHAWRFRITDGTWCDNPKIKTDTYDVRIVGDDIQVRVGGP